MVSVAIIAKDSGRPIPLAGWSKQERKFAVRAAKAALDGVGVESTDVPEDGAIATIVRRLCRDEERENVTESYLCKNSDAFQCQKP